MTELTPPAPFTHTAQAQVPTPTPARYLSQLCKHFQHKIPVKLMEMQGSIEFPTGRCDLQVAPAGNALVLRVMSHAAETLAGLEDVVARHLLRFAFRENLHIDWVRQG